MVIFQRSYKAIGKWQEGRRDVDAKDHQLLHEMADVLMDKPAGIMSKGSPGLVTRFGNLETTVSGIATDVSHILGELRK